MSFFQTNSNDLRNRSEQLLSLNQRFKTEKENLSSNEMALKSMWEGEANDSFHRAYMRDAGQMDAFMEVINNYAQVMETIADRYDNAEAKNLSMASNRIYV